MKNKFLTRIALLTMLFFTQQVFAQIQMERLNRGMVAVRTGTSNFVSWRWIGTEADGITFNLYRDGVKLNATPLAVCNYTDNGATATAKYYVKSVEAGVEKAASETVAPWTGAYKELALKVPAGGTTPDGVAYTYSPNDCSVGDVDGDGEYEMFVKWDPSNSKDNSLSGYTGNVFIDCYKLNGTFLWRIDLGINIRAGAHYTQFLVYDFDGDGKAEMSCKTGDGTKDGKGVVIGTATADYRNSKGYVLTGPEYLTVFNGQTGAAMATTNYLPARGTVSSWGDSYGNRVDRFIAAVAYFDGKTPSMVFGRGYYTRLVRAAWDWKGGKLTQRWIFDSNTAGSAYQNQGDHQMTVGDLDGDGKQELVNGSSAIDDDGSGYYNTTRGHGDALHMSDMDPDNAGLEIWICHEEPARYGNYGLELTNGKTGKAIFGLGGGNQGDIGRCMAADIDPRYKGYEMWAILPGNLTQIYDCKGNIIAKSRPSVNFAVYWDGDLQRELLDGSNIDKWDYLNSKSKRLSTFSDAAWGTGTSCNTTKATPNLSADLFGDWREEVVLHSADNTKLLIYTTNIASTYKFRTLMHDPQYRVAISWQNSAYNQPPHLGYYLGEDMATPTKPNITLIGEIVKPILPQKYIYTYDNSGNLNWTNANSWTPTAVPTAIDTVIIRTGEVQIANLAQTAPMYVEANGILRLIDTCAVKDLHLQGGTLKVSTSSAGFVLTADIKVDAASTILAGSVAATIFTLQGTITGNYDLTKTSTANLRIVSDASTFKGNWIVTGGKLQLRSGTGLGLCGVQLKSGARLDIETQPTINPYALRIDSGGVDLDKNLSVSLAVLGTENTIAGTYTNALKPLFIGSTGTLTTAASMLTVTGTLPLCPSKTIVLKAPTSTTYSWKNNTTQVGTASTYTANIAGAFTLTTSNANGCKIISSPIVITTDPCTITAIDDTKSNILEVFPNPFADKLTLKSNGDFTFEIMDINGKIFEKGKGNNQITIGETLSKGAYIVKIQTLKEVKFVKIVKEE